MVTATPPLTREAAWPPNDTFDLHVRRAVTERWPPFLHWRFSATDAAASDGWAIALAVSSEIAGEESPGSTEAWRRATPGGGNPRDSATEIKPPNAFAFRG